MYRFLLFSYPDYYPNGGLEDLVLQFNTIEELKEVDTFYIDDYVEIYDFKAGKEIVTSYEIVSKETHVNRLVAEMEKYLNNNAFDLETPAPSVRNEKTFEEMMEDSSNKFGEMFKRLVENERKER